MKTKNMIAMLAMGYLALGLSATAENTLMVPADTNEVKVKIEIDAIDEDANMMEAIGKMVRVSTKEAAKFSAEMAAIQAQIQSGELSEEEGEAKAEALEKEFEATMEAYGESMEQWGESFGKRMEKFGDKLGKEIEAQVEAEMAQEDIEAEIRMEMKDLEEELKDLKGEFKELDEDDEVPRKSTKTKFSYFDLHVGGNTFLANPDITSGVSMAATSGDLAAWESMNFRFSFGSKRKIGGASSPVVLQTGLGLETNTWGFVGDDVMTKAVDINNNVSTVFLPSDEIVDVRQNTYNTTYLELPVMLHLDLSPAGKVDKGLTVGVGAYGGIRLDSYTMVRGRDIENERARVMEYNNMNTQLLRYGLQGQLGYESMKVTGRVDAMPLFQPGTFSEDAYVASLSIGFCF